MKPYLKLLLCIAAVLSIAAIGNIYYEVLPGLQIKHPITGATTATINGTNGTVTAGYFVGDGSGLTGLPSGGAIPGTIVTNGASVTAGSLVKFGTRLTNVVDAASADVQSTICDTNKWWVDPATGAVASTSYDDAAPLILTPVDAGVTLDWSLNRNAVITLTGNVTFVTANLAANRNYKLRIIGCSTNSLITWPVGWHWYPAALTNALPSKWHRASFGSIGTTDANVEAACTQEQ